MKEEWKRLVCNDPNEMPTYPCKCPACGDRCSHAPLLPQADPGQWFSKGKSLQAQHQQSLGPHPWLTDS